MICMNVEKLTKKLLNLINYVNNYDILAWLKIMIIFQNEM
jgi:hypothetical protein